MKRELANPASQTISAWRPHRRFIAGIEPGNRIGANPGIRKPDEIEG